MCVQGMFFKFVSFIHLAFSSTKFVALNYDEANVPQWNSTLNKKAKITQPSVTRLRYFSTSRRKRQNSLPDEHSDLNGSSFSRNRS